MFYIKSDLFDKLVYAIENSVQRMEFSVLAIQKNCNDMCFWPDN